MGITEFETQQHEPQDDGPTPEHIAGITLWQQFEHLDDDTQSEIFSDVVRSFHHSSAFGLTPEQLEARMSLYEELLHDTDTQLSSLRSRTEPIDNGHDR